MSERDLDLQGETDGRVWAERFIETVKERPGIPFDLGTMTGWFANAVESGRMAEQQKERSDDG